MYTYIHILKNIDPYFLYNINFYKNVSLQNI